MRKAIRAFDKNGKPAYTISHSNKIFYPDKTSPTGLTTLTQALGSGQFRFETNIETLDELELSDPVIDPLVSNYIDNILSSFVTEIITINSTDWKYDDTLERYKYVFAYSGMKAGIYPSFGLVPTNLLPSDIELVEFSKIDCIYGQEDHIVCVAKVKPTTTLDIVIRGITSYGGLDTNLEEVEKKIDELKNIVDENKPQYFNKTLSSSNWSNKVQSINDVNITLDSFVEIMMDPSITSTEYDALTKASIVATEISQGSVKLKCFGIVPTINIPIIIKIYK